MPYYGKLRADYGKPAPVWFEKEAKKREEWRKAPSLKIGQEEKGKAAAKAAAVVGVSRAYVEQAAAVKKQSPELFEKRSGRGALAPAMASCTYLNFG